MVKCRSFILSATQFQMMKEDGSVGNTERQIKGGRVLTVDNLDKGNTGYQCTDLILLSLKKKQGA